MWFGCCSLFVVRCSLKKRDYLMFYPLLPPTFPSFTLFLTRLSSQASNWITSPFFLSFLIPFIFILHTMAGSPSAFTAASPSTDDALEDVDATAQLDTEEMVAEESTSSSAAAGILPPLTLNPHHTTSDFIIFQTCVTISRFELSDTLQSLFQSLSFAAFLCSILLRVPRGAPLTCVHPWDGHCMHE